MFFVMVVLLSWIAHDFHQYNKHMSDIFMKDNVCSLRLLFASMLFLVILVLIVLSQLCVLLEHALLGRGWVIL